MFRLRSFLKRLERSLHATLTQLAEQQGFSIVTNNSTDDEHGCCCFKLYCSFSYSILTRDDFEALVNFNKV